MQFAIRFLAALVFLFHALPGGASPVASGRHWQISIDSLACDAAQSLVTIGTRIRYLGRDGVVEAPVSRIVDAGGKAYVPRGLVWQGGSKPLAAWLSGGGMRTLKSGDEVDMLLRFEARAPEGVLKLEFGDVRAFPLTRTKAAAGRSLCESLLKPAQIQVPARPRAVRAESALPVFRQAYPCQESPRGARRTVEVQYPPYLPEQLLLFGRGYLPNAREVDLPMGKAAAQPYAYAGPDELKAIEDAARRALGADFPEYVQPRYFFFNWGIQQAASGNQMYSVGIYTLRSCSG